jgi:UDPglucose 6-dehydrogenase
VIFHDIDKKKLIALRRQHYEVTENISEAVVGSTISLVCVQTPTVKGRMDFSDLKTAIKNIAESLRGKKEYHVVAIRSTVLPSTTRTRIIPLLEQHSKLRTGEDFGVCVNPEFLRQASALSDFLKPSRIVIGELDKRSGDLLKMLYTPFKSRIFRTDLDTAETIKYVANTFLATKISFFNEMYTICRRFGLDPHFISEVVALDPRIGNHGVYGGRPFEGSCLPKDLEAFINFVKDNEHNPKLLDAVLYVNKKIAGMRIAKGETP